MTKVKDQETGRVMEMTPDALRILIGDSKNKMRYQEIKPEKVETEKEPKKEKTETKKTII